MFLILCSVCFLLYFVIYDNKHVRKHAERYLYNFIFFALVVVFSIEDLFNRRKNTFNEIPVRKGNVAVVTGGGRGIGLHVVKYLMKCGYHVVFTVRNLDNGKRLIGELEKENYPGTVDVVEMDLVSLKSVNACAENVKLKYPRIQLLVNNAGICEVFGRHCLTEDGFEKHFATNYLGHFLLTHRLIDNLKSGGQDNEIFSRIVNVSSTAHFMGFMDFDDLNMKKFYNFSVAYGRSKLAMMMFSKYLNKMLMKNNMPVNAYAAHPGLVATDMVVDSSCSVVKYVSKSPAEGAVSILYSCLSSALEKTGGNYISNCEDGYALDYSKNEEHQKRLFEVTCDMLKIKDFGVF